MIIYTDVISGREIGSDSYKEEEVIKGIIKGCESKKISIGVGEIDIGANASAEGGDDEGADDQVQQAINIVHTHQLTKVDMDKKEAKAFFKTYWKSGSKKLQSLYFEALGFEEDYTPPKDPKKAKKAIADAIAELEEADAKTATELKTKAKKFKDNFDKIKEWIKDTLMANFDEFEFYIPQGADLGACAIIPARYVGDAVTPTFYYFSDLVVETKE